MYGDAIESDKLATARKISNFIETIVKAIILFIIIPMSIFAAAYFISTPFLPEHTRYLFSIFIGITALGIAFLLKGAKLIGAVQTITSWTISLILLVPIIDLSTLLINLNIDLAVFFLVISYLWRKKLLSEDLLDFVILVAGTTFVFSIAISGALASMNVFHDASLLISIFSAICGTGLLIENRYLKKMLISMLSIIQLPIGFSAIVYYFVISNFGPQNTITLTSIILVSSGLSLLFLGLLQKSLRTWFKDANWLLPFEQANFLSSLGMILITISAPILSAHIIIPLFDLSIIINLAIVYSLIILTTSLVLFLVPIFLRLSGYISREQETSTFRVIGTILSVDISVIVFIWTFFIGNWTLIYSIATTTFVEILLLSGIFKRIRRLWRQLYMYTVRQIRKLKKFVRRNIIKIGIVSDIVISYLVVQYLVYPLISSEAYSDLMSVSTFILIFSSIGFGGLNKIRVKTFIRQYIIAVLFVLSASLGTTLFWILNIHFGYELYNSVLISVFVGSGLTIFHKKYTYSVIYSMLYIPSILAGSIIIFRYTFPQYTPFPTLITMLVLALPIAFQKYQMIEHRIIDWYLKKEIESRVIFDALITGTIYYLLLHFGIASVNLLYISAMSALFMFILYASFQTLETEHVLLNSITWLLGFSFIAIIYFILASGLNPPYLIPATQAVAVASFPQIYQLMINKSRTITAVMYLPSVASITFLTYYHLPVEFKYTHSALILIVMLYPIFSTEYKTAYKYIKAGLYRIGTYALQGLITVLKILYHIIVKFAILIGFAIIVFVSYFIVSWFYGLIVTFYQEYSLIFSGFSISTLSTFFGMLFLTNFLLQHKNVLKFTILIFSISLSAVIGLYFLKLTFDILTGILASISLFTFLYSMVKSDLSIIPRNVIKILFTVSITVLVYTQNFLVFDLNLAVSLFIFANLLLISFRDYTYINSMFAGLLISSLVLMFHYGTSLFIPEIVTHTLVNIDFALLIIVIIAYIKEFNRLQKPVWLLLSTFIGLSIVYWLRYTLPIGISSAIIVVSIMLISTPKMQYYNHETYRKYFIVIFSANLWILVSDLVYVFSANMYGSIISGAIMPLIIARILEKNKQIKLYIETVISIIIGLVAGLLIISPIQISNLGYIALFIIIPNLTYNIFRYKMLCMYVYNGMAHAMGVEVSVFVNLILYEMGITLDLFSVMLLSVIMISIIEIIFNFTYMSEILQFGILSIFVLSVFAYSTYNIMIYFEMDLRTALMYTQFIALLTAVFPLLGVIERKTYEIIWDIFAFIISLNLSYNVINDSYIFVSELLRYFALLLVFSLPFSNAPKKAISNIWLALSFSVLFNILSITISMDIFFLVGTFALFMFSVSIFLYGYEVRKAGMGFYALGDAFISISIFGFLYSAYNNLILPTIISIVLYIMFLMPIAAKKIIQIFTEIGSIIKSITLDIYEIIRYFMYRFGIITWIFASAIFSFIIGIHSNHLFADIFRLDPEYLFYSIPDYAIPFALFGVLILFIAAMRRKVMTRLGATGTFMILSGGGLTFIIVANAINAYLTIITVGLLISILSIIIPSYKMLSKSSARYLWFVGPVSILISSFMFSQTLSDFNLAIYYNSAGFLAAIFMVFLSTYLNIINKQYRSVIIMLACISFGAISYNFLLSIFQPHFAMYLAFMLVSFIALVTPSTNRNLFTRWLSVGIFMASITGFAFNSLINTQVYSGIILACAVLLFFQIPPIRKKEAEKPELIWVRLLVLFGIIILLGGFVISLFV